jgi:hypothetical protein
MTEPRYTPQMLVASFLALWSANRSSAFVPFYHGMRNTRGRAAAVGAFTLMLAALSGLAVVGGGR